MASLSKVKILQFFFKALDNIVSLILGAVLERLKPPAGGEGNRVMTGL